MLLGSNGVAGELVLPNFEDCGGSVRLEPAALLRVMNHVQHRLYERRRYTSSGM